MSHADDEGHVPALDDVRARRVRLRDAMTALESALAAPAPGRDAEWSASVVTCLKDLQDALKEHISQTEAEDGLFAQVLADAPQLSYRVKRLREDHVEVQSAVEALRSRLAPGSDEVSAVRDDGLALLDRLARHRQKGADLLYEAYSVDVSVGD